MSQMSRVSQGSTLENRDFVANAFRLADAALRNPDTATETANELLSRLRQCETRDAIGNFLETFATAIDALEVHASVRKTHVHNLADYKISQLRKG